MRYLGQELQKPEAFLGLQLFFIVVIFLETTYKNLMVAFMHKPVREGQRFGAKPCLNSERNVTLLPLKLAMLCFPLLVVKR